MTAAPRPPPHASPAHRPGAEQTLWRAAGLKDVSFEIRKGEIFGLIGPNGAGKTTLFNVMTALYIPESGSCLFGGVELTRLKPHQIAEKAWPAPSRTFACSRP